MDKFVLKEIKELTLKLRNNKKSDFIKEIPIYSISQMQIFKYMIENNDKTVCQKDLENALHLKKPTISGVLDTMEKNEIIVRSSDVNDARKRIIKLSKESLNHHKHIMNRMYDFNEYLVKGIPKDKLNVFFEVLDLIKDNLKEDK